MSYDPYLSELRLVSFDFAPKGWALASGQLMPINQSQALFSLLGTTFGGDGQVNFALPDLRGRVAMHFGTGIDGNSYVLGQRPGSETVTLNQTMLPAHNHLVAAASASATEDHAANSWLAATSPARGEQVAPSIYAPAGGATLTALNPAMIASSGGNQPHTNLQPYTVLAYVIALVGIFPSRN